MVEKRLSQLRAYYQCLKQQTPTVSSFPEGYSFLLNQGEGLLSRLLEQPPCGAQPRRSVILPAAAPSFSLFRKKKKYPDYVIV